jgi:putative heme-binding domain-containing protein
MRSPQAVPALAAIIQRDAGDPWVRAAVLSSLAEGAGEMFRRVVALLADVDRLTGAGREQAQVALQTFARELVQLIGARNDATEVAAVLDYAAQARDPGLAFALVHGVGEGLQRAKARLPAERVQPLVARARKLAVDRTQPVPARVQAIELLALTSFAESGDLLLALLALTEPQPVQLAALQTLGHFNDPRIGPELTKRWSSLTLRLRNDALAILVARRERIPALLDAVEAQVIRRADFASPQIDFLMNSRDAAIKVRAIQLLAVKNASTRQEVLAAFQPALSLPGDPAKGRKTFTERCAYCHRIGGEGHVLGPDLESVRNTGKEKLLIGILDPNREVLPQYLLYEVETREGSSEIGILSNESASSVTIRQPFSKEVVVPRANIANLRSIGQSVMPELEGGLTPQDMADLLEFIATAK